MNFGRDAPADQLSLQGNRQEATAHGENPSIQHREDSIETLFREYLAQRYQPTLEVPVAAAASSRRLRAVWMRSGVGVAFDRFAQDAFAALQYAYDRKYGVWDNVNDLRTLYPDSWHARVLPYTSRLSPEARILGVGSNDGREIRQLFGNPRARIDLVDLSAKAVGQHVQQLGNYSIRSFVGTFEDWVPDYDEYDLFFSLRTLNCTAVDRRTCVPKSIDLVKVGGTLIYSVANGYVYVENGVPKALHGMFSYEIEAIDVERPREIADEIRSEVETAGARVIDTAEGPAEIFIVAVSERPSAAAFDGLH